jgi:glycosyltransferase involved in cell wall biosynthesis
MEKVPLSIIILTYNEEANIQACLESVHDFATEIFIVDSYSTDRTLEIAGQYTQKIYQNPWTHYAGQRQWALANLPLGNDWIFFLDADERFTPAFEREVSEIIRREIRNPRFGGYYVPRRFFFLKGEIKWGGCKGSCKELRLCNRHNLTIGERAGHEIYMSDLEVDRLTEPMIHEDHKPLTEWIARHNRYSSFNAEYLWALSKGKENFSTGLNRDIHDRWLYWKEKFREHIWHKLPIGFRPTTLFMVNYFFRLGFLDGMPGFLYAFFRDFWYHLLIDAKYYALKKNDQEMQ